MARATAGGRLDRLDRLTALLKADEPVTVAGLAGELGVDRRTLWRDIALLRERGLPIEADRGRGGGIRLNRQWGVGRLALDYQEAVDLLISLAIAERMRSPLFMAGLRSVRRKLAASFAPALRSRLERLRARILVGQPASAAVMGTLGPPPAGFVADLNRAFLEMRQLRVVYRGEGGGRTERVIEPHYLLLNYPVWYVLAWDHLRGAVRTFRCDRLAEAETLAEPFRLRPAADFDRVIAEIGAERV